MPGGHPGDPFLTSTRTMLQERFGIGHATLQVETGDGQPCSMTRHAVI
jgi:cobalt-zinc-cadmium efflux system protein